MYIYNRGKYWVILRCDRKGHYHTLSSLCILLCFVQCTRSWLKFLICYPHVSKYHRAKILKV